MAPQRSKVQRSQRMLARRRQVRRERTRRRRRALVAGALVIALTVGGWMLVRSSLFALDGIEVAGNRLLGRAEIIQASGLATGMNVLSVHPGEVRARIGRLPMVESASVLRVYPSRVRIAIVERTPRVVLETIEGRWYLDREGFVLGPVVQAPATIPRVVVAGEVPAGVGERVYRPGVPEAISLVGALPSRLLSGGVSIEASSPNRLVAVIGSLRVMFGSVQRLTEKVEAVRLVLARAESERAAVIAIDVRAPSRPAARFARAS